MPGLEIIDIHTHTFATRERGIGWQRSNGAVNPPRGGTIDELLDCMKRGGVTHSVMLMYTPTRFMYEARIKEAPLPTDPAERQAKEQELKGLMAQRMIQNNEWACQVSREHPQLITFAGLDPVYMSEKTLITEIEDKVKKGAKGVKIVPLALEIYGNDKRLHPVYDKISRLGIPMVAQSGGGKLPDGRDAWGSPKYFAEPLREFPNLKINLAHLGGHGPEVPELCKTFPNLYVDISGQLTDLDKPKGWQTKELVEFIRRCGAEHITWGTNFPMNDPAEYAQLTEKLPLTSEEKETIAHKNAKRIIGIK